MYCIKNYKKLIRSLKHCRNYFNFNRYWIIIHFKICFNVFYIKIVLTVKFNRYSSQFKYICVLIRFTPENCFKCLFIQFFLLFFHDTLKIKRNCLETRRADRPGDSLLYKFSRGSPTENNSYLFSHTQQCVFYSFSK